MGKCLEQAGHMWWNSQVYINMMNGMNIWIKDNCQWQYKVTI